VVLRVAAAGPPLALVPRAVIAPAAEYVTIFPAS
jgi:hypothetical protein